MGLGTCAARHEAMRTSTHVCHSRVFPLVQLPPHRSAVYFETKQFEQCMEDCDQAVERGREVRADFKIIAKALARKGSALAQLGR